MVGLIIAWSLRHRLLVLAVLVAVSAAGIVASGRLALDAMPDLTETQVILKTVYPGQSPQAVEDLVTYPLASALLSVPGSTTVRGFSTFGESFIYIIFEDGTDPYWARARVLEYLSQTAARLPPGIVPSLGPDASGVGWIFEYALVDRHHRYDPDQIRAVQDYFLKYELQSLPGVAEVASVGGMARQFRIEVDPSRLAAYRLTIDQIAAAVRDNNQANSGSVLEMGSTEFVVRAQGYLTTLDELRAVPIIATGQGAVVRLEDVATVQTGPALRRGVAELNGEGEVAGGIVVMRYDHNALETAALVKARLKEISAGLPPGLEIVTTYDRSAVIARAVANLRGKLFEESAAVAVVCLLFLFHLRSSLVAVFTLPVGILAAFAIMKVQGVSANIMSLGGIAIAVGAMVDASIVMIENMHKHLERAGPEADRWDVVRLSATEVGPSLFFSLLIITVSFLPVLTLGGQEGRLFTPLAYTKTYAMAASAILAITATPVLMGYLIRGRIADEARNPLNRLLHAAYRPSLMAALNWPKTVIIVAILALASAVWPLARMGSEFMPPLDEGDLLYMPTTLPGVSIGEAARILQITDRAIRQLPEVETVFGKAGAAETATDPAPVSMIETTIVLKPRSAWPKGETTAQLIEKLDDATRLPGLTNSWGYPIRTRMNMLSTGIRTPVGIKITGPSLDGIAALAERIEAIVKKVPGTRSVLAERVTGGRYLDVDIDRFQAARYGISVADVQRLVRVAVGGEEIGTMIDGRQRFPIVLGYPRDFRDSQAALAANRITTASGAQIPLGSVAKLHFVDGPSEIKSENGRLTGYVYVDIDQRDLGGYVAAAQHAVATEIAPESGYAIQWSGQYQDLLHAKTRMMWVVPVTLILVLGLLQVHFRDSAKVAIVALCVPFSLIGGFWLTYFLGYNLSVAVAVGFISLAGVAAEFGIVMVLYIDSAIAAAGPPATLDGASLRAAIVDGALMRIRPKMMTVAVIMAGLLPVMFSAGTGSDVMQRIAAPLVGGMVTAPLLSLLVVPAVYLLWIGRRIRVTGEKGVTLG